MDIMLDLETLGVRSTSKILTLAAITFTNPMERNINTDIDCFYSRIDLNSYNQYPDVFTEDLDTVKWWNTQAPKEAKEEAFNPLDRKPIHKVLIEFKNWCQQHKINKIWSHGSSFDVVIISHAMTSLNVGVPWKFWNIRDTRTLYDLAKVNLKDFSGGLNSRYPEHHAIGDCERQIQALKKSYNILFPMLN